MKICKIAVLQCFLLVVGCGGSGSDLNTLSNAQPQNGGGSEVSPPGGFRLVETLFDGQSAVRFFVPSEPAVYTGIVEDQTIASELYNGSLHDIKDTKSSKVGDRFYVEREALSSQGKDVLINISGLDLSADGSEYASRLYIEIEGGDKGYLISGTPVEVLPKAQVTYSGFIEIIVVDGARDKRVISNWISISINHYQVECSALALKTTLLQPVISKLTQRRLNLLRALRLLVQKAMKWRGLSTVLLQVQRAKVQQGSLPPRAMQRWAI